MAIVGLYSKRRKAPRKTAPDVYKYTELPQPLRVQIVHILRDLFGHPTRHDGNGCLQIFGGIEKMLSREYGLFHLARTPISGSERPDERVTEFVLNEEDHARDYCRDMRHA